jgi:arabinogalactan endo-1,4-beta-galactosidase
MWPATDEGQRKFAADLVEMLNKHKSVDGLYWWWPESNEYGLDWNTKRVTDGWYNASLFDNETGRALTALAELKAFLPEDTGIDDPSMAGNQNSAHGVVYDLSGRRISTSLPLSSGTGVGISTLSKGIYIIDGRKYVVK